MTDDKTPLEMLELLEFLGSNRSSNMSYIGNTPDTEARKKQTEVLEQILEQLKTETQGGKKVKSLSARLSTIPGYDWQQKSKIERVRLLSELARKDEVQSPTWWRARFRSEFPEGYSTELGRVRDKFYREYPGEKFAINGLAFYKGDG